MLSKAKQANAIFVGEACTKTTFKQWNEKGRDFFPKGVLVLRSHCMELARIHVENTARKATEEERELAAKSAADLFDLFVEFHKRTLKDNP